MQKKAGNIVSSNITFSYSRMHMKRHSPVSMPAPAARGCCGYIWSVVALKCKITRERVAEDRLQMQCHTEQYSVSLQAP